MLPSKHYNGRREKSKQAFLTSGKDEKQRDNKPNMGQKLRTVGQGGTVIVRERKRERERARERERERERDRKRKIKKKRQTEISHIPVIIVFAKIKQTDTYRKKQRKREIGFY